jgi:type III restriction enzyme
LQKIQKSKPDEAIEKVFQYLEANNISFENLITELKEDFSKRN